MSQALLRVIMRREKPYTRIKQTKQKIDFVVTKVNTSDQVLMVAQPAETNKLKIAVIDYTLEYLQIHSRFKLSIGEYVFINNTYFKLVAGKDYHENGSYWDMVGEEFTGNIEDLQ